MATIRKRTLPSGKAVWLAGYKDGAGKRRFRQFDTRKEADAFLIRARSEVVAGLHVPEFAVHHRWRCGRSVAAVDRRGWARMVDGPALPAARERAYPAAPWRAETDFCRNAPGVRVRRRIEGEGSIGRDRQARGPVPRSHLQVAKGRGLVGSNSVADVNVRASRRKNTRPVIPTKVELRATWRPRRVDGGL